MIASNFYDCVVVGAGPAGCTTASLVAERGFRTLLIERDALPRFHVGESLMPETFWTFKRLGIVDELRRIGFVRKNGVQFVNHNDKESAPFFFDEHDARDSSVTWHVERKDFDQLLYQTAEKRGANCQDQTRVTDIQLKDNPPHNVTMVDASGKTQTVSARVIVDATGQQSFLANRLGVKQINPDLKKAAIWTYYKGANRNGGQTPEVTCILQSEDKDSWFWYIPLMNDIVSVGCVGDNEYLLKGRGKPEQTFEEELDKCPGARRRIAGSERCDRHHVAKEFSYTTSEHAGDGWVMVGDAYGFIDPIYSSGVFLALKSGEMAADAICDGLRRNDVSAEQLSHWTYQFDAGVNSMRRLVHAFYTKEFSFGGFMKEHPQHQGNLTDLLIGRVFDGEPDKIFEDMDPWIERSKAAVASSK